MKRRRQKRWNDEVIGISKDELRVDGESEKRGVKRQERERERGGELREVTGKKKKKKKKKEKNEINLSSLS